ncbi:MAG: vanadium-dependent haloperoxidase [Thermoflavifilum sp.]|nr:vanadium-dependent haloperoxidase [Thermoflavifilum sp.]
MSKFTAIRFQALQWFIIASSLCMVSCHNQVVTRDELNDPHWLHQSVKDLDQVIIYDVFSPPVAARIYAYSSLASYEAIRFADTSYPSLATQMHDFPPIPHPISGETYSFMLAGLQAFYQTARQLIFSTDSLKQFFAPRFLWFQKHLDPDVYNRSMVFGNQIAATILQRATRDNYRESRGYPEFSGSREEGKWRPTPPEYMNGVEPYWYTIHPFTLDSSSQFRPEPPIPYDMRDTTSAYYRQVMEVYLTSLHLTREQKNIANFWDCNPYTMIHQGHLMFANKKITPGGHWMGIAGIVAKQAHADMVRTAETYAITAAAVHDGFISCWDAKYHTLMVRPVTVINDHVDATWHEYLQTPPFPEYPSAHSTISAAAAVVLGQLYGDSYSFVDSTEYPYIGQVRSFHSFKQAAQEAAISRLYGGIHYRKSCMIGSEEGQQIGEWIVGRIHLK